MLKQEIREREADLEKVIKEKEQLKEDFEREEHRVHLGKDEICRKNKDIWMWREKFDLLEL